MTEPTIPAVRRRTAVRPTVGLTIVIAAAAFALSFVTLTDLAATHGVPRAIAWLWPVVVDATIVAGTLVAVVVPTSRYGWLMLASAVGVSIAGNAVHGAAHGPVGVAVAAVPPLGLVMCTHALVVLLGRDSRGSVNTSVNTPDMSVVNTDETGPVNTAVNTPAEAAPAVNTPVSSTDTRAVNTRSKSRRGAASPTRTSRAEYITRARRALTDAHGRGERPDVTVSWVMNTVGCSRGTAAKIAAELRTPHAVPEAVDQ